MIDNLLALCCARSRNETEDGGWSSADEGTPMVPNFNNKNETTTTHSETITSAEKETELSYVIQWPSLRVVSRYAVVKNDVFLFETKDSRVPSEVIVLHSFRMNPQIIPRPDFSTPHTLQIVHQTHSFFRAESSDVMGEWINHINKILEDAVDKAIAIEEGRAEGEGEGEGTTDDDKVVFEGLLEHYGMVGDVSGEWTSRWFVLSETKLKVFASAEEYDQDKTQAMVEISLTAEHMVPEVYQTDFMTQSRMFQLFYAHSSFIAPHSRDDYEEWNETIAETIQRQQNDRSWMRKNPVGWKRAGKVREVVSPLIDLLRDPFRLTYFQSFVSQLSLDRLLLFWLDVQQFRRLCKKEDKYYLKPCAVVIYQKYIKKGSEQQVDVSDDVRERTLMMLDDPAVATFRDAQVAVLQTLRELYPHFLTSQFCHKMGESIFQDS